MLSILNPYRLIIHHVAYGIISFWKLWLIKDAKKTPGGDEKKTPGGAGPKKVCRNKKFPLLISLKIYSKSISFQFTIKVLHFNKLYNRRKQGNAFTSFELNDAYFTSIINELHSIITYLFKSIEKLLLNDIYYLHIQKIAIFAQSLNHDL